jgi:hypothetical protein
MQQRLQQPATRLHQRRWLNERLAANQMSRQPKIQKKLKGDTPEKMASSSQVQARNFNASWRHPPKHLCQRRQLCLGSFWTMRLSRRHAIQKAKHSFQTMPNKCVFLGHFIQQWMRILGTNWWRTKYYYQQYHGSQSIQIFYVVGLH